MWEASWSQQQSFFETLHRFQAPPDLPLHFMLTHLATNFGRSEFWVRLPTALLGVGTVLLVFLLGRRAFGKETGLAAALLVAIAPFHVWYAQEARPYAGLAFYSLLSLYCYHRLLQRPSLLPWIGFTVATTLNIYNHLFGLFPLFTQGIATAIWAGAVWISSWRSAQLERREIWWRLLRSVVAVGGSAAASILPSLPLLNGITRYLLAGGPGEVEAPPFQVTGEFLLYLFGLFGSGWGWALWLVATLFLIGLAAGLYGHRWFVLLALAWLGIPLVILWLAQPRHIFIPRYFLFMQPVYLLITAYGLVNLSKILWHATRRVLSTSSYRNLVLVKIVLNSILVIGVMSVISAPTWESYRVEKINDWSAVCQHLRANMQPGDVISGDGYFEGIMLWCFDGVEDASVAVTDASHLEELTDSGRNIWYTAVDPYSSNLPFVRENYSAIPREAWAKPGFVTNYSDESRLSFPQGEHPMTLYYHEASNIPHRLEFHDVPTPDSAEWPDYAQVLPGRRYAMRLSLPATAPRIVRILFFDLGGRDLNVIVDHQRVARIVAGKSGGKWVTTDISLPPETGETFLLELENPGAEISAFSVVEVRYSKAGTP